MKTIHIMMAALLVSALVIAPTYAQMPGTTSGGEQGLGRIGELTVSISTVLDDTIGSIGACCVNLMGTIGDIWNGLLEVVCQENFLALIGCIYPSFEQCMIGGLTGLVFGGIMGLLMCIPFLPCCGPCIGCIGVGFFGDAIGCLAGALTPLTDVHMTAPGTYRF